MERRTVSGAQFLWLVLQHVLPKGFRRARNFGFLHPNCKRLIALLQVLLRFAPGQSIAWVRERGPGRANAISKSSSSCPYSRLHLGQAGIFHFSRFGCVVDGYQALGKT